MKNNIAECVGLWLAEGDQKTKSEITFTNNCLDLVEHFHNTIKKLFEEYNFNIRVYIYNPNSEEVKIPINCIIKRYTDKRATKPYFIWRVASVELVKRWKEMVEKSKNDKEMYLGILRGFFAGEGTVKETSHCSRSISMSQNKRLEYIDRILDFYKVNYKFSNFHRQGYIIQGRENLEKVDKMGIADLHNIKKEKFKNMLKKYKQTHYKRGYLKNRLKLIFNDDKYFSTKQLAKRLNRSEARISEILVELKKEGILNSFKLGDNTSYWISKNKGIILSKRKFKYLNLINNKSLTTKEISGEMNVCFSAVNKRLKELNKLNLITRNDNKLWEANKMNKELIVI